MVFFTQPMFQLFTILITALSSFFLIRSVIKLSPLEAAKMSGVYLEYNPKIGENFAVQKADTVIGFVLLMLSILVQIWVISQPLRWVDVEGLNIAQTILTLIFFFIFYKTTDFCRDKLVSKYLKDLHRGLKQESK